MLKATIGKWDADYERRVNYTILDAAENYRPVSSEEFPSEAIAIGDNWLAIRGLVRFTGYNRDGSERLVTLLDPLLLGVMPEQIRLWEALCLYKSTADERAIIPGSKRRLEEAKRLGTVYQHHDDWFCVDTDWGKFKVFRVPEIVY